MKAGHSKLDGYSATLPATRPSPRLSNVVAPLPFAVLAPPPARLLIALLFPRLLRLLIRFLRHRPWHLLPMTPPLKPVVQLLVRNLHPQFLLTPGHRLPYRPKPSFRCYLPKPLRLLCPPCFDCLYWVGLPPPNPPPHTTKLTAEPTCGLPPLSLSPASNARLVATTTMPATALLSRPLFLLCKACEMFLQNASMQSSRDGSYGPALRGGKNTKLREANRRKWDKYGESFEEGLEPFSLTLPHALPLCFWEYHAGGFGSFLRAAAGWRS